MTDEEKAEDYYEDNECYSYLSELEDFEAVFGFVKDRVKQAYLDGLAEGRKETVHTDNTQVILNLEKENAKLSKMLELAFGDLCSECNCPYWNNVNWEDYRAELEKRVENEK